MSCDNWPCKRGVTINELIEASHNTAVDKGWWTLPPNIPEKLALIHSEISEALEAYRDGKMETYTHENGKPDGFEVELADAVIRIADLCGYLNIDLESAILRKAAYNSTRQFRHGGKIA